MATIMKRIRALLGFTKMTDGVLLARAVAVITALTGNAHFTNLPFDLALLKAATDTFSAMIAAALDGSKKAIADKDKQREVVINMLIHLSAYVEANCQNDPAIFTSSGFEAASTTRNTTPAPLAQPGIKKIDQGDNSGQLMVRLIPLGARHYELSYSPVGNAAATPVVLTITNVRAAVPIHNLTPGTTYSFQVRALAPSGVYTDWSDPATRMVI